MTRINLFLLLFVATIFSVKATPDLTIDAGLEEAFSQRNLRGVFVVFDASAGRWMTNDADRATHSYLPASTFKIPNSLIALECGSVADAGVILKWDGKDRGNAAWNRDQNMRDAFRNSTVWFYQELARRTGEERMRSWVSKIGYGNADISGGIDVFWLEGGLRISAVQQIEFLRRLRDGQLPFKAENLTIVKEVMIADQRDNWVLRAKTGMALRVEHPIAWYVGWVETPKGPFYFALNFDISRFEDARPRQAITYENLARVGVLPGGTEPPR